MQFWASSSTSNQKSGTGTPSATPLYIAATRKTKTIIPQKIWKNKTPKQINYEAKTQPEFLSLSWADSQKEA